jgi:hypothetical protein
MVNIVDFVDSTPLDEPSGEISMPEEEEPYNSNFKRTYDALRVIDPGSPRLWSIRGINGQDAYESSIDTDNILYGLPIEFFEEDE